MFVTMVMAGTSQGR